MSSGGQKVLQAANIVGFAGTLAANGLANALPINGRTTGELSELYPNLFVPAGLTFSIWGLIYLLLAVFTVYQARGLFSASRRSGAPVERIGGWFLLSSAANAGWIVAWHYEQVLLSVLVMLVLLASLLALYLRLGVGSGSPGWGAPGWGAAGWGAPGSGAKLCLHLPFSVYLGWITIATVANLTALLVDLDWGRFGLGEEVWTVAVLVVAAGITVLMLLRKSDVPYALVVLWAFAGIALKRLAVDPQPRVALLATLGCAAALILVLAVLRFRSWLQA